MNDDNDTATPAAPQVWASFDCECPGYLTRGKRYLVMTDVIDFFTIVDDEGDEIGALWDDCPNLDGGNWTRHTSPDAEQEGNVRAYGRLSVDPNNDLAFDLLQDDDQPMAFGYVYANPADARGLVAAWNACEGIPTEALEAGVVVDMLEALRLHQAWSDSENAGPNYGDKSRDTHPDGEKIWRAWFDGNIDLCARATEATRAAIAKVEGKG
jgi:hypothetical protein